MTAQAIRFACAVFVLFVLAAAPRPVVYHIELDCGSSPCTFPVSAVMGRYARLQTYVTTVRLKISPAPDVMPRITWRSANASRVTVTSSNPFELVLHFAGDTAAPTPNPLIVSLVPGHFEGTRVVGDAGPTSVSVEVGAAGQYSHNVSRFCLPYDRARMLLPELERNRVR